MNKEQLDQFLNQEWVDKADEASKICPICGATVQVSRVELHKGYHTEIDAIQSVLVQE